MRDRDSKTERDRGNDFFFVVLAYMYETLMLMLFLTLFLPK